MDITSVKLAALLGSPIVLVAGLILGVLVMFPGIITKAKDVLSGMLSRDKTATIELAAEPLEPYRSAQRLNPLEFAQAQELEEFAAFNMIRRRAERLGVVDTAAHLNALLPSLFGTFMGSPNPPAPPVNPLLKAAQEAAEKASQQAEAAKTAAHEALAQAVKAVEGDPAAAAAVVAAAAPAPAVTTSAVNGGAA